VEDYLGGCVQHILCEHGIDSLNLLGICEGGVLTMCCVALHSARVRSLILTITPVDFHADRSETRPDRGFVNLWTRSVDEADIQRVIDSYAYVPGKFMGLVFSMITPARTLIKYNLDHHDRQRSAQKTVSEFRVPCGLCGCFPVSGQLHACRWAPAGRARSPLAGCRH
jgi:polyhydroxyalkanoate synthase subunit PhaC